MDDFEFTDKNPRFFYDVKDFPYLQPLVANFGIIKQELLNLINISKEEQWLKTFPGYVKSENKKAWKVFQFMLFSMKFPQNATLCPKTSELIFSIPEILSCNYSYMNPHTQVLPHKGYSRMVLRCHLPLIVPDENLCGLRVGNQTIHWKEGELIIFDDSFEHEAWNKTDERRVVLMFDIPNPLWKYTAHEISRHKIKHIEDPFLLSLATKEEWWEAFEKGVIPSETFTD